MKLPIAELISFMYAFSKINFIKLFKLYDKKSNNIIWTDISIRRILNRDIGLIYDICFLIYFISINRSFRIVKTQNIGKIHNSSILINLSRSFNKLKLDNWGGYISDIIKHLESQNNIVSPSHYESEYWENKIFMYNEFKKHNLSFPKTTTLDNIDEIRTNFNFPLITKIPHGAGSMGIEEIKTIEDLENLNNKTKYTEKIIIQERINMTMDSRIVIIGYKYFDHYFRVNQSEIWHPTSTSMGSVLKYDDLQENVIEYLESVSKKLNLRVAAYDVCWKDNDTSTKPIILEVSPAYLPNPRYYGDKLYKKWKREIFSKNPYWKLNVDNLIKHRSRLAEAYINE